MAFIFVLAVATGAAGAILLFTVISFLALREFVTIAPTDRADHRVLFWCFFEQAGSSFNFLAENIVNRNFGGWQFPVGWFQSINPIGIVILAPLLTIVWSTLNKMKAEPSIPRKFGLGLIFNGLSFVVLMYALSSLVQDGHIPFWPLALTYIIQTVGELCLSPVGLSMVTKLAPRRFASLFMGDLEGARARFAEELRLAHEHGLVWIASEGIAGVAAIAARQGESERAARLLGAAESLAELGNVVGLRLEQEFFSPARQQLGESRWGAARAEGARLSFDEAVRLALEAG